MESKFMQKSPEYQGKCMESTMDCTNHESIPTGDCYIHERKRL